MTDEPSRADLVKFGLEDGPEFFAPWAVTRENAAEAVANAHAALVQWQEESLRDEQWSENTDQVIDYVAELLVAVERVLR